MTVALRTTISARGGIDAPPDVRRRRLVGAALCAGGVALQPNSIARAANLPTSNGASGAARGTAKALAPILRLEAAVARAAAATARGDLAGSRAALDAVPAKEKDFKRLFDEFSVDVSYKQRYKDANAFVVYYSGGFDGAGRDSIEAEDPVEELQKSQYGFRNEAWAGVDDARAELAYLLGEPGEPTADLASMLARAETALARYVALAPADLRRAAAQE